MKNSFKNLLVLPIVALMAIGMASCGEKTNDSSSVLDSTPTSDTSSPTSTPSSDNSSSSVEETKYAAEVKEYLAANYGAKEKLTKTADFTLPVSYDHMIDDNNYVTATIAWSLAKESGLDVMTLGEVKDGFQTVNVKFDDGNTEESVYKVTGSITISATDKESVEMTFTVPKLEYADFAKFAQAAADKSSDVLNVKGTVVALYNGNPYFVNDANEGFYAYSPKLADDSYVMAVGDVISVAGTATKYNGQYEFNSGCTITKVSDKASDFAISYTDVTADWSKAANNSDTATLDKYQNRPVMVTGATMGRIDKSQYYYYFTVGEKEYYFRPSGTMNKFGNEAVNELVKEWTPGYTVNLRGLCSVYSGVFYIQPIELGEKVVEITSREIADEVKVQLTVEDVASTINNVFVVNSSIDLPAKSGDVDLTYTLSNQAAVKVEGGKLVATAQASDVTATLTIKGVLNGKEGTTTVTIKVLGSNRTVKTAAEAYTECDKLSDGATSTDKYFISGTMTSDPTADYCNFYLDAGDGKTLYVYGLSDAADAGKTVYGSKKSNKMPDIHKGDRVVIYANLQKYAKGSGDTKTYTMEAVNAWLVESACIAPTVITETPADGEITLGDIAIALNEDGMIVYASYRVGCGGPHDGYYADGTIMIDHYKADSAGKTVGIFKLQDDWAPWSNDDKTHYSLYTIVLPDGWTIITGNSEQMTPVVNSIFGTEFTSITGNTYFENTLAKGAMNDKVITQVDKHTFTATDKSANPVIKLAPSSTLEKAENMKANLNNASLVGLDPEKWNITSSTDGSNHVYVAADCLRLYGVPNHTMLTVENLEGVKIVSFTLDLVKNYDTAAWIEVKAGDSVITPVDGVYTINSTKFSIQNINPDDNKQIRITSINMVLEAA